jgi:hypothetical protein
MKPALLPLAALLLAGSVGCGNGDGAAAPLDGTPDAPAPSNSPADAEGAGTLSFGLTTQSGLEFDSFDYVITGPGFTKAGAIDVSDSNTVSARIDGIPAASGYSLTLSGTSTVPAVASCSGSASFSITARTVSNVPVDIQCHVQDGGGPVEPTPSPVPLPPFAPLALGIALAALGAAASKRR